MEPLVTVAAIIVTNLFCLWVSSLFFKGIVSRCARNKITLSDICMCLFYVCTLGIWIIGVWFNVFMVGFLLMVG